MTKNIMWNIVTVSLITFCAAIMMLAAYEAYRLVTQSPQPAITVWQYKGHDMLRYSCNGEVSVCHSPECRKCVQVYD